MTFAEARAQLSGERLDIYEHLLSNGPRTCGQVAAALVMQPAACLERLRELRGIYHVRAITKTAEGELVFRPILADEAECWHRAANPPKPANRAGEQIGFQL